MVITRQSAKLMRAMQTHVILTLVGITVSLAACTTVDGDTKRVREQILSVLDTGAESWNRGDIDGYIATFSDDARWVSGGTVLRGKSQIAAAFKARFDSSKKMGRLEAENVHIDLLTESDALVFGHWIQSVGDRVRRGVFTLHIKLIGEDWLIVSDHSSTDD